MGFDSTAVTLIGVKVLQEKLKKYLRNCDCGYVDDGYCPECSNKIEFNIPFKLPEGVGPVTQKHSFVLYQENLENEYDNEYLFICLNIQKKDRYEKIGKNIKMSETKDREFLKETLLRENLLTQEEFDENYGIYTFLETSW